MLQLAIPLVALRECLTSSVKEIRLLYSFPTRLETYLKAFVLHHLIHYQADEKHNTMVVFHTSDEIVSRWICEKFIKFKITWDQIQ